MASKPTDESVTMSTHETVEWLTSSPPVRWITTESPTWTAWSEREAIARCVHRHGDEVDAIPCSFCLAGVHRHYAAFKAQEG